MPHAQQSQAFQPPQQSAVLAREWRRLTRAGTVVAICTAPAFYLILHNSNHVGVVGSALLTVLGIVLFRGLVEVIVRRLLPSPSLLGGDAGMRAEDIISRRRYWFWRTWWRRIPTLAVVAFLIYFVYLVLCSVMASVGGVHGNFWHPGQELKGVLPASDLPEVFLEILMTVMEIPLFLLINVFIFLGPFMLMAARSIKSYEPGDASWGVKLDDVRGQADAKEEISRVITLWQSGEEFERAGGKRERGLLFLGAPGTGKTMISKAIATSFNCPFVTIPGSGFAGMFIGMDTLTVWLLARRARKLARKWGGQCIVFIDEIDAVGMRRQALNSSRPDPVSATEAGYYGSGSFYGPNAALNPSGDLIVENRQWRDYLFAHRAEGESQTHGLIPRLATRLNAVMPGGMFGGGSNALNALLVVMDGMGEPPGFQKWYTNRLNTFLDALFVIPQRVGKVALRLPAARPRKEEIYFIGACNVPIQVLDPALTRPGRMGRHIWFRTPTLEDRLDIFDLYITRVDHEPDLDTPTGRDELARITNGYSPAMIEQACSMALTVAHAEGRARFSRTDLLDAMFTVEAGTAQNLEYIPEESRATAIHEVGHAVASHVYLGHETMSTRLTIRKRGDAYGMYVRMEKEERHIKFRNSLVGSLITTLGAMAAEHVFYRENSQGVGGDLSQATNLAATMVGVWGMGPDPVAISIRPVEAARRPLERGGALTSGSSPWGRLAPSNGAASDGTNGNGHHDLLLDRPIVARRRLEEIGNQLMNRASGSSAFESNPLAAVLGSPEKQRSAAILLGEAYVTAYSLMVLNRDRIEELSDELVARKEIFGDELNRLLEDADLHKPDIDLADDTTWPSL